VNTAILCSLPAVSITTAAVQEVLCSAEATGRLRHVHFGTHTCATGAIAVAVNGCDQHMEQRRKAGNNTHAMSCIVSQFVTTCREQGRTHATLQGSHHNAKAYGRTAHMISHRTPPGPKNKTKQRKRT